ncbi:SPATA20 isoform 23 [Pan troglodytes]|uniref:Spermatogenesis associated 20 n=3 Tax=Hominidae TaxID=9604 RepID=D6R947_HUMAN|nr:SPATA20 isoform 6 [Pan troglodytes]PNJ66086.1 SPATA20 isoform 6 [Pongo abelii]PNI58428.1 SPATA20 isoform 7 [Pan troglodytes]PNI58432.1 SPATA20 isoform 16 [Pan troglodytes]PNI58434.1 SPATA20 isoform 21 [Pan troglodytes]
MLGARAWLGRVLLLPRAGAGLAASRRSACSPTSRLNSLRSLIP